MNDLQIIDRLLVALLHAERTPGEPWGYSWQKLEAKGGEIAAAIQRLRLAYRTGEETNLAVSLIHYFENELELADATVVL